MAKIPDFSELTKKLDIQGLMDSVKSAVAGVGTPPKPPEGDEVAAKFVDVLSCLQNLSNAHAEQAKLIGHIHTKINSLYNDVQTMRNVTTTATTVSSSVTTPQASVTPKPTSEKTQPPTKSDDDSTKLD